MWNYNDTQSQIVRNAVVGCRNRIRVSMYRTRNPIELMDILFPFSFLFVPGARTPNERDRYIGFKTVATPRNVETESGVSILYDEIEGMTYSLNIIIVNTINNKEVGDAFYVALKEEGATALDEYTVALTQSPYHRTNLLYKEDIENDRKTYYLFTNKMNDVAVGRLAGCVCKHMDLFGEYTDTVAAALLQGFQSTYENIVTAFAEAATVEEYKQQLKETLEGVGKYGADRIIARLERDAQSKQSDITTYLTYLNRAYDELRELQRRILGVQHQGNDEDEVTQFLHANINNITYAKLHEGYLYMRYRTPLLYWDEDVFKILRESSNDNPMRPDSAARQQLVDDIFGTRKVVLWFDSGFRYNLVGSGFKHIYMQNQFHNVPSAKGLPNPHHYYYNCWGDNEPRIIEAQNRGNNVIALAQIFSAIAGVNLSDSVVCRRLIDEMFTNFTQEPCLEIKETNEFISLHEYYRRHRDAQQTQRTTEHQEFPFE